MSHFAKLDANNIVISVDVVDNNVVDNLPFPDSEPLGVAFLQEIYGSDTVWKQTSYSNSFRVRYAGIGFTYDAILDAFIPEKPYPSWILNTTTYNWNAPAPYPNDGKWYYWDEPTLAWVLCPDQPPLPSPPPY